MKYALLLCLFLSAQILYCSDSIPKFKISIGYGGGSRYILKNSNSFYNNGFTFYKSIKESTSIKGPFHLKLEYRLKWWLGLGLNANYMKFDLTYSKTGFDPSVPPTGIITYTGKVSYPSTSLNLRTNFYFLNPIKRKTKSELYIGFGLGYNFYKIKISSEHEKDDVKITLGEIYNMGFEITAGYRYKFSKHLALYSELGYAKSILQIGITGSF